MKNFRIFDGQENQFDTREVEQVHRWALPGTHVIFPRFESSSSVLEITLAKIA